MPSGELKKKFLEYFISKNHKRISNSSLIPDNDPSALFINSGMHPIVPYLMGEPHYQGKRLVNYQRALRTNDLENVGVTKRHHTFFEMLGEWSLGDYWKKESLEWSFEFITKVLHLDPKRLHATVFSGNELIPRDEESIEIWKKIFESNGIETTIGEAFSDNGISPRIITLGAEDNFWKVGDTGPCGPCSEIYYDLGTGDNADERYLEICNNVLMSYNRSNDGTLTDLSQKNIDVGWGFERILCILQNIDVNGDVPNTASNFETDLFIAERDYLLNYYGKSIEEYEVDPRLRQGIRVILDHMRASVMLIGDGVEPSNKDRGYVLRRLLRRAVTFALKYSESLEPIDSVAGAFIDKLGQDEEYKFLIDNKPEILSIIDQETDRFEKVIQTGIKELSKEKSNVISGELAFRLKESLGLPVEITAEIAEGQGKTVDFEKYNSLIEEHKEKSRLATGEKFVGGLADYSNESVVYHTCAHLLLAGMKKILGSEIHQKGQNITSERLRYDINHKGAIPQEKLQEIENWINEQIDKNLKVDFVETTYEKAIDYGVEGMFGEKYEKLDKVKIYRIYPEAENIHNSELVIEDKEKYISLEFCGGPHVSNTSEIKAKGKFKIVKEEGVSEGVRRVRGVMGIE